MRSKLLSSHVRLSSSMREASWSNYQEFLRILLDSTDHPMAKELLSLLSKGEFVALVDLADSIASTVYLTPAEHRLLNQLAAVIRKYPFPPKVVDFDPRAKAYKTFLTSEHKCKWVNRRFNLFMSKRSPYEQGLHTARSYISYVLGDFNIASVTESCNFGPGASIFVHGNATNSARKLLARRWSVSPGALNYAQAVLKRDPLILEYLCRDERRSFWCLDLDVFNTAFRQRAKLVGHNKIAFVPKTAKTERTIAVEPLLNGYLQTGVDEFMRKRLKRVGIDLSDQTRNQRLAKFGSLPCDDPYVTIDLSSASDSISTGLCRYMLPPEWFDYLNSIRSRSYNLEGNITPYEKFVTMGNGFCFPLETLLFASLCHTAYSEHHLRADFSVYGDDIIVRQSVAGRVLELLRVCGFKANLRKTFLSGPFRESCGADWFEGEDVRPITLDYAFDSPESVYKFCNLVNRKLPLKAIFAEATQFLVSLVPEEVRFVRPILGQDDSALEVDTDVFMSSRFAQWTVPKPERRNSPGRRLDPCWTWVELVNSAWPDEGLERVAGYNVALMRGVLTGSTSSVPFAERRKSRTKIRRIAYCSNSSEVLFPGLPQRNLGAVLYLRT